MRRCIARWVHSVAEAQNVSYSRTSEDLFAAEASRLSDAAAELDAVEYLLIALRRAKVLTPAQRVRLQGSYLR